MIRPAACALIVLVVAAPATHAQETTVDVVDLAFARWMKEHGVARGTLAVAREDRLVLVKGYGGVSGERRGLIASLSKAITGACVVSLIQQGKLRFDTPLGDLVPAKYGEPRDPRLRTVTVAQLLTHRSGFGRGTRDPATGATLSDALSRRSVRQTTMYDLVPGVLRHTLEHEPGARYAYTNASHLLLGIAIETVTGKRYEEYCAGAVLEPHGIKDARLHPTWQVLGSFGGWSLSGPEYLAFLRNFAPSSSFFHADTRQWMLSAAGKEISAGGPLFYSLLNVRPLENGGHNFFHAGHWAYRTSSTSRSGGVRENLGTLAVSAAFGAAWFVSFEPHPGGDGRGTLDRELYRAVESVRTWPEGNLYAPLGLR